VSAYSEAVAEAQREAAAAPEGTNPKQLQGRKKVPFRFLPRAALIPVAYVMALGADKYGWWNWRKAKLQIGDYLEAVERHLTALYDGEDADPESGESHWAHIAASAMVYLDAELCGMVEDDRPHPGPSGRIIQERRKA
jgi:hypothetical protein